MESVKEGGAILLAQPLVILYKNVWIKIEKRGGFGFGESEVRVVERSQRVGGGS
jgi:hypothetical protein